MAVLTGSIPVHNFDQQNQISFSISTHTNAYANAQQVAMEERTQNHQETQNPMSRIKLPVGMRFNPTDQQIISYFLARKINGQPILPPASIPECDIYGEKEPWKIFDKDMDETFYVFTKLKRRNNTRRNNTRIHRRAGRGTWQNQNRSGVLDVHQCQTIGYHTMLSFKPEKHAAEAQGNGRWILHEFSVEGHDIVLCKIRNRDHGETLSNDDAQQTSATNKSRKRVQADEISQRKMARLCETGETEQVSANRMESGLNSDQSNPSMYFDLDNNSELDLFDDRIAATSSRLDEILCSEGNVSDHKGMELGMHTDQNNPSMVELIMAPPKSMICNSAVGAEQSDVPHTAAESNYSVQEKDDLGFDGLEDINLMEEIPSLRDYDLGVDTFDVDDLFNFDPF